MFLTQATVVCMIFVGLTGGIASGKSTVAARFAEHGAYIIDADQVARQVVEPGTPALAEIVERFGLEVINQQDGSLNRPALGRIVFSDPEKLAVLNGIVHPRVKKQTVELIRQAPDDAVVVYDVPLLVEAALDHDFDAIITVSAPEDVRRQRLVEHRGMTPEDAAARVAAQASESDRLARATHVVDSNGPLSQTVANADEVWRQLTTLT